MWQCSKVLPLWQFGNSQKTFPATQLLIRGPSGHLHTVNSSPLPESLSKSHLPASGPHTHWLNCIAVWAIQGHDTHCLCGSRSIWIIFHHLFYLVSFQSKVIYPLVKELASFWKSLPCFSISHMRFCLASSYPPSPFLVPFYTGISGTHMGHSGDQGLLLVFIWCCGRTIVHVVVLFVVHSLRELHFTSADNSAFLELLSFSWQSLLFLFPWQ